MALQNNSNIEQFVGFQGFINISCQYKHISSSKCKMEGPGNNMRKNRALYNEDNMSDKQIRLLYSHITPEGA